MPDTSLLSPFVVKLGGGLMLDKDAFTLPPGAATQLQNFEPISTAAIVASTALLSLIQTSYRRLARLLKRFSAYTSTKIRSLLHRHKVFKGGATGSWTEIDTGRHECRTIQLRQLQLQWHGQSCFCRRCKPSICL